MAPILFNKIKSFGANIYLSDFGLTGQNTEELIGMVVSVAADSTDLSTIKAMPYLGTGTYVGVIHTVDDIPSGYENLNANWNTIRVSIVPFMPGFNMKAKGSITAGSFVKAGAISPQGIVAATDTTGAIGIALEPATLGANVKVVPFLQAPTAP